MHFLRLMEVPARGRLLELGCGEGRDVVFFASHGFDVEAIDGSPTGVSRTSRALEHAGLRSSVALADIAAFTFLGPYDVGFANNSLQFVGERALDRIRAIREHTAPGGWNAVGMFIEGEGNLAREPGVYLLESGELKSLYGDWQLFEYGESIIYSPRRGAYRSFASLIARRPS
jgi:tellurite methyltransferase